MNKLVAIIKREYLQKVRTKFFVIMTVLGPLMLVVVTILPGLLISMKTGGDTRIAILDQTEGTKLYDSIRESLVKPERDNETNKQSSIGDAANSMGDRLMRSNTS
jgi:ABC-type Na+ efflux pump permease subunit